MTTIEQDRAFLRDNQLVPDNVLELAVDWIAANMNPDDVFSAEDLKTWAFDNGFSKE